jgi:TonB-dependent starch-binding outer membrane protein SusC
MVQKILKWLLPTLMGILTTAGSMAQTITMNVKKQPLKTVFADVGKQTGYSVFGKEDMYRGTRPVTVSVANMPLETFLQLILKDQPLDFRIEEKNILLTPRQNDNTRPGSKDPESSAATPVSFSVSGAVRDIRNKPLDGASVVVKRSKQGTITDAKGLFTLKNIRPADTLIVTFIGYNARQVPVSGQMELNIALSDASSMLDEVVTQAYSKSSQRYMTGNITRITAKEIEKQPVMNPLLALQGRVPGMVVSPTNGFASAPVKIEIRGLNSLNTTVPSAPMFVIDGVPLTVLSLGNTINRVSQGFIQSVAYNYPSLSTTNGQSELFSINPRDIESIEILKDADATAVYGSRGSNGVILITTKKGKPGKMKFDFNINPPVLSFGRTTRLPKLMNTQQYLQMRREAFRNDGITPTIANAPDLLLWDTTRYTDWAKEAMGGRAKELNISASVSGGSEQTSFRISADYTRLTNTTNISGATNRVTFGTNINTVTRNQKLTANLSTHYSYEYVNVVQPVGNALMAPNAPPAFDKDGNPNWEEWNDLYPFGPNLSPANPQSTNTLGSSLRVEYKPLKGLVLSAILGYNFAYNATDQFTTIASQIPNRNNTGSANFSTTFNSGWVINPQVTYTTRLGKGTLQLTAVGTEQAVATNGTNTLGTGYESDLLLGSINNASVIYAVSARAKSRNASLVGGINYIWDDKYIINLNGTRQGSSKFGPQNKYGNFGSIGLAWIASEEKWLRKALPDFVSFLKFRGSYGLTGSDGILDYQYLALWRVNNSVNGYNGQMALIPSVRPNQQYKWEDNRKLEVAADLNLLKNKLNLSVSYYRNRVSDQLTSYPTPGFINTFDITGVLTNLPLLLQNSGWEGSATAELVSTENFSLSANFNIGANKNVILSFPNIEKTPYLGAYQVGSSVNTQYTYRYLGIDPLTGRPAVRDYNHDGAITIDGSTAPPPGHDDRGVAIDLQPKFTGGFGFNGIFRKLSFSFFFSFTKQMGRNLYMSIPYSAGAFNQNLPPEIITNKHWQKPGDIADYPAFSTKQVSDYWGYLLNSDFAITDASYIRLNNAFLSYPLPEAWSKKIGLKHLAVNFQAQNVLTFTRYKGGDPETQVFTSLPPAGLYTFSFTYKF